MPHENQQSGLKGSLHVNICSIDCCRWFLQLLCKFDPKSVLKFLESYENYRLEHCLQLCQKYEVTDAAVFILERVGDVASALSLVLSDVELRLHQLEEGVAQLLASSQASRACSAILEDELPEVECTFAFCLSFCYGFEWAGDSPRHCLCLLSWLKAACYEWFTT